LHDTCAKIQTEYMEESGNEVELSTSTLGRLVKGGKSKSASNAEKGWLLKEEEDLIIKYAIAVSRGFGLSHKRLKVHVDLILSAQLGSAFREGGVGKRWSGRFIEKHRKAL
ncbi:hypothetical protein FPV67DRAFT_1392985, partial [Lyophyllum atratum]